MKIENNILNRIFFCAVMFCIMLNSHAQDLHYSQYFNSPLLVNPANTGFAPDADWRAGINYRNQWSGLISNPYKTFGAWGDAQLFNNRFENGWLGLGGSIIKDVAGSGNLSSTKIYTSIAYHQQLGLSSLLSGGFALGAVNKSIEVAKLTFDNQWNGKFFDINIPSGESFNRTSVWYLDLQAGLNYAIFPSEKAYFNVGFSASHINNPNESFFSKSIADTKVGIRYNFFANGSFKLNDQWIINPNAYFSMQNKSQEKVIGINTHYNLSGDGAKQLIGGLYYRKKDAFIPLVGYQIYDLMLTVNYDVTTSSLGTFNQTRGAYELSLVKTGLFSSFGKNIKCPVVKF